MISLLGVVAAVVIGLYTFRDAQEIKRVINRD